MLDIKRLITSRGPRFYLCLALLPALLWGSFVYAEDEPEEGEAVAVAERIDYEFKPFVTNFDGHTGRLHYVRMFMTARCDNREAFTAIREHRHLLRNNILFLLNKQTFDTMGSAEGREMLRLEVLETVQQTLLAEAEVEGISDILFQQFMVQ